MDQFHQSLLDLVRTALDEDIGRGDLTSLACLEPGPVTGAIVAKSDGVLSGTEAARLVFHIVDSANELQFLKADGKSFSAGDRVAQIRGFNQTVLASERVALNFLGHLSGVATKTSRFVQLLRAAGVNNVQILDTRKTTPGWRLLEKQAVSHGGGANHRMGLYDQVLIKDNHIASAGSITDAVRMTREFLNSPDFRLQFETDAQKILIEVEVESEEQLREAIAVGVDRLLLDNQSPESLASMVSVARSLNPAVGLEASGNVSLENIVEVARSGVDFVSVGAITHSAPVADFSLRLQPEQS